MRTGLIGDNVDRNSSSQQFGEDLGSIADDSDRKRLAGLLGGEDACHRRVKVGGVFVKVSVFHAAGKARLIDVDDEHDAAVHGHGQRLRAAHAPCAAGEGERARKRLTSQ